MNANQNNSQINYSILNQSSQTCKKQLKNGVLSLLVRVCSKLNVFHLFVGLFYNRKLKYSSKKVTVLLSLLSLLIFLLSLDYSFRNYQNVKQIVQFEKYEQKLDFNLD